MEMFLPLGLMVYTFRNLFVLQEYVLMLKISTKERTLLTPKLLKQGNDTINFILDFTGS